MASECGEPTDLLVRSCEEFEALPRSRAFDCFLDANLVQGTIDYHSSSPVLVSNNIMSDTFPNTFYFPHSSIVDELNVHIVYDGTSNLSLNGSFVIGEQSYTIRGTAEQCVLSTEDSDGNRLDVRTPHSSLLELLLKLADQEGTIEFDQVKSHIQQMPAIPGYTHILKMLANLNGTASITREATVPGLEGDRAMVVSMRETESRQASAVSIGVDFNWEIFDQNTELSIETDELTHAAEAYRGMQRAVATRRPTQSPVSSYFESRSFPELYGTTQTGESKVFNPYDTPDDWARAVVSVMSSLGPSLRSYRHFDEPEL